MNFKNWLAKENFNNFPEGERKKFAIQASLLSKYDTNILLKDQNGDILGIASVWKEADDTNDDEIPSGKYIRIRNMAVKEKGLGEKLFDLIEQYAKEKNAGIFLNSTYNSEKFYIKQGMKRGTGLNYYLTLTDL